MTGRFTEALLGARRPVIMELKRQDAEGRSLFGDRSVARIVTEYQDAGAPCLSVVTGRWFGGTRELLREVMARTHLPVLLKDFIIRRSQLEEAHRAGVSAVLLTASVLPRSTLDTLVDHSLRLGLTPFVEVASEAEIGRVPRAGECLIAVNNKDIATREHGAGDTGRSVSLLPAVVGTGTRCAVSAGGIHRPDDAARLLREGFSGLLIGTGLLRADSLPEWLDVFDRCRETAPSVRRPGGPHDHGHLEGTI
ncbi:indole-3-glycerol-phosphate synthase [Streptomyces sp. NPDC000594]|uniref:indole-3-glycerol-phosphate synthase n=1 Tax=Streptomyces sp. NPDC000594 TaxID=3154261 RepID=UPI00332C8805